MPIRSVLIGVALTAGIVAVYLLPPSWLAPLSAVAAVLCGVFAIIIRVDTRSEPSNAVTGVLLSVVNLPEQPLAKVKEGWVLSSFLASATFLVALGLSVLVRASV